MKNKDVKNFCAELESRMKEKLELLGQEESDVTVRCNKAMLFVAGLLHELKEFVRDYQFTDLTEEIYFFKVLKPAFMSQYLFFEQVLTLKTSEPSRLSGSVQSYYVAELEKLQVFNKDKAEFIQYCQSEETKLDDRYFVRGFVPATDFQTDRDFSTVYDVLLSRIMAAKLVTEYIISVVENLKSSGDAMESPLNWTGSKADLIELIYGLETVGVVNNGSADIKEIARRFETLFNINLGNYYRQFLDIRLRKKEKTTFLNQMKARLEVRMDDFK